MTRTGQKTAFAFAGGGSLGAIQVGMLRVLLSAGVQPDFVVGASAGAMNAAYFAGAPNADGVARLAEIWSGVRRREVFSVTFKSAFCLLRHPESVIDSGGPTASDRDQLGLRALGGRDGSRSRHRDRRRGDGGCSLEGTGDRRHPREHRDTGRLPAGSNRRPDADGRRNRQEHSHSGGGGPRSVTDRRASNWIRLRLG